MVVSPKCEPAPGEEKKYASLVGWVPIQVVVSNISYFSHPFFKGFPFGADFFEAQRVSGICLVGAYDISRIEDET